MRGMGLKVNHFKTTLRDVKEAFQAGGIDPDIFAKSTGEKDFESMVTEPGTTPFQIIVHMLGTNWVSVMDSALTVVDEYSQDCPRKLWVMTLYNARVNDDLRKKLEPLAMDIKRGRVVGTGFF
jgi:hypothetical protein